MQKSLKISIALLTITGIGASVFAYAKSKGKKEQPDTYPDEPWLGSIDGPSNPSYTVQQGDSLSLIAERQLGNKDLWQYLASINNIASPYVIVPGQIITVAIPEVTATGLSREKLVGIACLGVAGVAILLRKNSRTGKTLKAHVNI